MLALAEEERFEEAEKVKRQLFTLEHIRDVAVISRDDLALAAKRRGKHRRAERVIDLLGRIEGYDISNISGQAATGSMVVFREARPQKSDYRKFKIKTIKGSNDVGMLKEVLKRRFNHLNRAWPRPKLILIDGGRGQINAAKEVLANYRIDLPIIGIAKGLDRKKDEFVFDKFSPWTPELERIVSSQANLLKQVRNEAHRFAITYHRQLRKKRFIK